MSDYQSLIIHLNEEVESLAISIEEKKELMDACEAMESNSMNIAEFAENLIFAVKLASNKAPQIIPTMLLIASDIAESRLQA